MKRREFLKTVGLGMVGATLASRLAAGSSAVSQVMIDVGSFREKGGWVVDSQFIGQMGSPYLLAHGMGVPVRNARAEVSFPSTGQYQVWVRTKNWCPGAWKAPGQFQVLVDGVELKTVFGTEPGWAWQKGGIVPISKNNIAVELKDLTGFEGRCDAVFFTSDLAFVPPNDLEKMKAWRERLKGEPTLGESVELCDVVIIGGGIAGCAAALAAEKQGLRVALVHDRPVLGGNASSEVRVHTEGVYGKGGDILKTLDTKHWPNGSAAALRDEQKRQATLDQAKNVRQFLNFRAFAVKTEGNRIVSVRARPIGTGVVKRLEAPVFIDCTGDGAIGALAGAEFRYGRESQHEFGEGWAEKGDLWSPETPDSLTMGTSVLWNSERLHGPASFPDVPWALPVADEKASTAGDWDWEYASADKHQINDAEEIRDHLFRAIYGTFSNAKTNPHNANVSLKWVAYVAGRRESRRLVGDYTYTMQDAVQNRHFEDTVAEEKRVMDVHYQVVNASKRGPDFLSEAIYKPCGTYYVPFRTLYSKNIENLMMAGRCFSCSHVGLGGPRVMRTCGQMGIATGYAASLCIKHGTTPRGVYNSYMPDLRRMIGYI
jgi:hypothetical protein